jgi:hypothetical protein
MVFPKKALIDDGHTQREKWPHAVAKGDFHYNTGDSAFIMNPPAPRTKDAEVKGSEATLHGAIPRFGGAGVTERGFYYATADKPNPVKIEDEKFNPATNPYTPDAAAAYSVPLKELQAGVEYRFRAYAVAGGKQYLAEEYKSFTTAPPQGNNKITMTVAENDFFSFSITARNFTVDWGDGTEVEMGGSSHTYTGTPPYTVTITGDNISKFSSIYNKSLTTLDVSSCTALTYLSCAGNQLTSLDVSKNAALAELWCHNNPFTSLDVSNCTSLRELECQSSHLTAEALDALFNTLPLHDNIGWKTVYIHDNPGRYNCDRSIAIGKGWTVNTTTPY